jgi:hypothetical protein
MGKDSKVIKVLDERNAVFLGIASGKVTEEEKLEMF